MMFVINSIINILVLVAMVSYTYIRVAFGKASRYTNAKYNGKKIGFCKFLKLFSFEHKAITLTTDQGTIACVHGTMGGYFIEGQEVDEDSMVSHFEAGEYTLVSCANATHRDFSTNGKSFKRDAMTLSNYCTILLVMPWGDFLCWGGKLVTLYVFLLQRDWENFKDTWNSNLDA